MIYVTPKDGGPVVACENREEAHAAIKKLRAAGYGEAYNLTVGDVICDFCSHPEVHYLYSVRPGGVVFVLISDEGDESHGDADGLWGACEECYKLISTDQWAGLENRSFNSPAGQAIISSGVPGLVFRMTIKGAHGFFQQRWREVGMPEPRKVDPDWVFLNEHGISS